MGSSNTQKSLNPNGADGKSIQVFRFTCYYTTWVFIYFSEQFVTPGRIFISNVAYCNAQSGLIYHLEDSMATEIYTERDLRNISCNVVICLSAFIFLFIKRLLLKCEYRLLSN